jgi:ABC-type phosphate transport system auxiliary subunit
MRQLGYDTSVKTRRANFTSINDMIMVKKKSSVNTVSKEFETLQLQKRITELESQLKDAEMKAILFSTMVDIAEKEFNIPIRKKYNTKPSKK